MNDQSIDRALREALDVSPSPDFVARVRTRIANEPVPHSLWSRWTVWMPVTVCAVAAAIALAVFAVKPEVRLPVPSASEGKPDTTAATNVPLQPVPTVRRPAPSVREGKPDTAAATGNAHREPEILISQSESAALRRLIARASEGQIIVDVFSASASDSSGELQPLPEITIPLLKIDPLVPVSGEEGVRQ
jgi:negative regulator of sigma E activity